MLALAYCRIQQNATTILGANVRSFLTRGSGEG